eukprot:860106-Pleurochrysis_carterae.AAC.1
MRGLTRACSYATNVLALLPNLGDSNPGPSLEKQARFRRVRETTTLEIGRRAMSHKERDGLCSQSFTWCISRDDAAEMLVQRVKCKIQNLRRGIRRLRLF